VTKFKEATEAFEVLSDASKRANYDQFGSAEAPPCNPFGGGRRGNVWGVNYVNPFGFGIDFDSIFNTFRDQDQAGQDHLIQVTITLLESIQGCKKDLAIHGVRQCNTCSGSGLKPGEVLKVCSVCKGSKKTTTYRGHIHEMTCSACMGRGKVNMDPCPTCSGQGQTDAPRTISVTIPSGINAGQKLRIFGYGGPGKANGSRPGDLYVEVQIAPHPTYTRKGIDLITSVKVTYPELVLGSSVQVPQLDGSTLDVLIPKGSSVGSTIVASNKGVPVIGNTPRRGSLHIILELDTPKKLSDKAKTLLAELQSELKGTKIDVVG
jgi:molecular chaperone DnaJ